MLTVHRYVGKQDSCKNFVVRQKSGRDSDDFLSRLLMSTWCLELDFKWEIWLWKKAADRGIDSSHPSCTSFLMLCYSTTAVHEPRRAETCKLLRLCICRVHRVFSDSINWHFKYSLRGILVNHLLHWRRGHKKSSLENLLCEQLLDLFVS